MGLKDDFEAYKQRRDAKRYFRSNNEAFLDAKGYCKLIVYCLLTALIGGILMGVIQNLISMNLSILYILLGYAIAMAIRKVTQYPRINITLIGIACYFMGIIWEILIGYSLYFGIICLAVPSFYTVAFYSLIHSSIFTWLFIGCGIYTIYYLTK